MSSFGFRKICFLTSALLTSYSSKAQPQAAHSSSPAVSTVPALVKQYCADCHDPDSKKGGLDLLSLNLEDVTQHPEIWEKVDRKLRTRQMPPPKKTRPDESTYAAVVARLESSLDSDAAKHLNP